MGFRSHASKKNDPICTAGGVLTERNDKLQPKRKVQKMASQIKLPSPDELNAQVEGALCQDGSCSEQAMRIAKGLIAQVREQILKNGLSIEHKVSCSNDFDWLVQRQLRSLLFANSWCLNSGSVDQTLTWTTSGRTGGELPTYWELYKSVEAELRQAMSKVQLNRGQELAVAMLDRFADRILSHGSYEFTISIDRNEHWLTVVDAEKFLRAAGWTVFADKSGVSFKLGDNCLRDAASSEPILSPAELRQKVIAKMRAAQSEVERGLARQMAVSALAQVEKKVLEGGTHADYEIAFDANICWLILRDTEKLIESFGWRVFGSPGSYKISADHCNVRCAVKDLPTPCEVRERAEAQVRNSQTDVEKAQAARLASMAIDEIRHQIVQSGSKIDYSVPIRRGVHWLIREDTCKLLDQAGWQAYFTLDALMVCKKNQHRLFF
ncbi:hypothetical protein BH10CYA1_BH10CYA1_60820 [soil metagenome]